MARKWMILAMLASPVLALGQSEAPRFPAYQAAVPPPTTNVYGGGWGGYNGASTAAGSALNGMSQVISAAGQNRLNTSAAAINMTQARSNELHNEVQACQTFWEIQNTGKAEREADRRRPPPTAAYLAQMAHYGIPNPLTPSQMDPVSGRLYWPDALQDSSFAPQRAEVDQFFAKWAANGVLDYAERNQVRETINAMFDALKAKMQEFPPQTYLASKTFLQSLVYAATKTTLS